MNARVLWVCVAGLVVGALAGCGRSEPTPAAGGPPTFQTPTRPEAVQKIPPPPGK